MAETDLWVHAELAARDRGWSGDPERAAWSKQADHVVHLAGQVGWLAVLFGGLVVGRRPYGSLLAGLAATVVLWRLAQVTEDRRSTTWFRVGGICGLVVAATSVVGVVTLHAGSLVIDGSAALGAFIAYALGMASWSWGSGWPQSGRRYARAAIVLLAAGGAMAMTAVLAWPDLATAPRDAEQSGISLDGHHLTGWAANLGGIAMVGVLAGLLLTAYANAGISQVHRPPPWWRRRRAARAEQGAEPGTMVPSE